MIRQAIATRQIVVGTYDGYERHFCPHALGYKDGDEKAVCYQFAGGSKSGLRASGDPANWRCIFVGRFYNVRLVVGPWHTAVGGHSRHQVCIDEMVLEIRG